MTPTAKPILFSGPMVRALLDGRKTQTRRILKPTTESFEAPKYRRGDRLWVREAHYITDDGESEFAVFAEDSESVEEHLENMQTLMSSHPQIDWTSHIKLRPSIHMPRWASRLTLTVTDVRVQRLQGISEGDAEAEGIDPYSGIDPDCCGYLNYLNNSEDGWWLAPIQSFRTLWNSINGPDAWDADPWVAAYTFTVHRCNIDELEADHG